MDNKSNEDLVEEFENLNFNDGYNAAKGMDHLARPMENLKLKEEILSRITNEPPTPKNVGKIAKYIMTVCDRDGDSTKLIAEYMEDDGLDYDTELASEILTKMEEILLAHIKEFDKLDPDVNYALKHEKKPVEEDGELIYPD